MWATINLVLAFSITAATAAIVDHLTDRYGLRAIVQLWLQFVACHLVVTAFLIPRMARWLARKDAERAARLQSRRRTRHEDT
jgi:hypothetical protein